MAILLQTIINKIIIAQLPNNVNPLCIFYKKKKCRLAFGRAYIR